MEHKNQIKIKSIHRFMATICLALFCCAIFVIHYQPIRAHADNSTENHYRMPSGINITYYDDVGKVFSYPMYAYTTISDNDVYSGIINPVTGAIDWLATNHLSAPDTSNLAVVSSWLIPPSITAQNPRVKMIEFTISDFYSKFNESHSVPVSINITDDTGNNSIPLCDVFITYTVFNFDNGIYQTVTQTINDLDLNSYGILANKSFTLDYFITATATNKTLHCKEINVLVIFDELYDDGGMYVSVELTRITNDAINTYNDALYEHTWQEVEVKVNYLASFFDTVTGFLAIELLPSFTIGTMLELAIAIPLVVWFLKSWLGG